MTNTELEVLIGPALRRSFGHHGLDHVVVRAGEDHDGDPVLFITVFFASVATMPAGGETTGAMVSIRRLLLDHDESRFPHLTFRYPDDPSTRLRLQAQWRDLARA